MNQQGLAAVWIVLITALISLAAGGGAVWYWQQSQEPETTTPPATTQPTTTPSTSAPSSSTARTEEPFTLVGTSPYGRTSEIYRGYVIVEGEYSMDNPFELTYGPGESSIQSGEIFFRVDQDYKDKMPKVFSKPVDFFIVPNTTAAVVLLMGTDSALFNDKTICKLSGNAKIALSDFVASSFEGGPGVTQRGTLAEVLSTTKPVVTKCQ